MLIDAAPTRCRRRLRLGRPSHEQYPNRQAQRHRRRRAHDVAAAPPEGPITWITARGNLPLLQGVRTDLRCLAWDERDQAADTHYDLAINLEDEAETAAFVRTICR